MRVCNNGSLVAIIGSDSVGRQGLNPQNIKNNTLIQGSTNFTQSPAGHARIFVTIDAKLRSRLTLAAQEMYSLPYLSMLIIEINVVIEKYMLWLTRLV